MPGGAMAACTATMAAYNQLDDGISYKKAVKIIGCEGEEVSRSNMAGFVTFMVMWNGTGFGSMSAMFQNGRLISKSQMGLN